MHVAVLAHDSFPDRAKTAIGVLRYGDHEVQAVVDRSLAGDRVAEHVPDLPDVPIVESIAGVSDSLDALVIGVAPVGGGFDESWRRDVRAALERGCDVHAGLHAFLADDPEFARIADANDCALRDVRRPPADLTVAEGTADEVSADVVCTVGTDCSSGKMTTSFELRDAARELGIDAAVVPTGQTGILIADRGIAIDRVIADFAAGAVERLVRDLGEDHDLLIVEGQGAITHPAYSGVTTSILHGAMPDRLVLCHVAGREAVLGYESFPVPAPTRSAALSESMAAPVSGAEVVAGAINTQSLEEAAAREAVDGYLADLGVPTTDPVRFGVASDLVEAIA